MTIHDANPDRQKAFLRYGIPLLAAVVLAITLLLFFQTGLFASAEADKKVASPAARPPATVEVTSVKIRPSVQELTAIGTLLANESVVIRPEVGGRITAIQFEEGATVEAGTVLFTLDQSVLRAELAKSEADLKLHESNYRRAKSLLQKNAISTQEHDEAYAQWLSDKADIQLIQANLDKTVIRAPFSGTLGLRSVSVGDVVTAGQEMVNLEDTSRIKVEFGIPEVNTAQVREKQKVTFRSDAFPDTAFEAEVYAVNPRLNSEGRNLVLRAVMENTEHQLRPGQFVRVDLEVGRNENALFVPEQALVPQPERQFIWKVADGRATMTEVTIGKRENGMVEIRSGLDSNDVVITGGLQKIGEGAPVNAVQAKADMFDKIS